MPAMKFGAVILAVLASLFAGAASAHPFNDRADVVMEVEILDPQRAALRVMYLYDNAFASFNEVNLFLDKNGDGNVTREERDLRFKTLNSDLIASVALEVTLMPERDGKPADTRRLVLTPDPAYCECIDLTNADNTISQPGGLKSRNLRLGYTLAFTAALDKPLPVGRYAAQLGIVNNQLRLAGQSENMRAFDARGKKRVAVSPITYDRNRQGLARMRFTWVVGLAGDPDLIDTGDPSVVVTPPVKPEPEPPPAEQPSPLREEYQRNREDHKTTESRIEEIFDTLRGEKADALVWILALLFVFGLGAWHAIQPGHGKTLVAGYLIGTQGKKSDAIFLGIVVTLAHTSGVLILMGGAWAASKIWPETMIGSHKMLAEWIAVVVGATIFLMGVGLVLKRSSGKPDHAHDAFGRHVDESGAVLDEGHSLAGAAHGHSHRHHDGTVHSHPSTGPGQDGNEHAEIAEARAAVAVASESDENWLKEHAEEQHDHAPAEERLTRWQILRLGILGGVIPCPTAFVIGLIAFQQQWYFAGLMLVLVFSLGLAVVLSAIGLTLVISRSYLTRKLSGPQGRVSRFLRTRLPVIGALIITLIGFAMVLIALLRLEVLDLSKLAI
ncbi:MAG: sulfite exporter TauE/SafE family protein [Planctomycetes bacterium]|nr:sulfite exporter TauE/SafE family protein [Planctomycetota bacterium]